MAKEVYKIPYTVDNIRLRALVSLKVGNFGPKNQVFVYQIVGWLGITLATAALIYMTPIKYSLIWGVPIFLAAFFLGYIALKTQPNGLPGYRWMKPTFNYMLSKNDRYFEHVPNTGVKMVRNRKRKIETQFAPALQKMRSITDVDAISGEDFIGFQNGDVGAMFRVSGFTSLVILDQEMDQVIEAIEKWFNSLDPATSWVLITDHSNQRVINQQEHIRELAQQWKNQPGPTPEPIALLLKNRYRELSLVSKRYKSSQQYLMLRTDGVDTLDKEIAQLQSSSRAGMLKSVEMMSGDDALKVMHNVMYGG